MTQTKTPKLDVGDPFPAMSISLINAGASGSTLELPAGLSADFTILLGYRGKW